MSVVYRALDTTLGREVAVKMLHPHLAQQEESRLRFAREARAVARLRHPNILEVFDFSPAEGGEAFLVTEHIRGPTLGALAARERFHPPEIAAMAVHELAAALAHAHAAGVIHRDIKPENVMVHEGGVLKLMDFGIAKLQEREERMTVTGALVGSPTYMAPEIVEGEAAGPQADIFSLGNLLYFLATSRLPFSAPNTTALLRRILDGTYEDPRQVAPAVSDELATIIATCLSRQPSARYESAAQLKDALAGYLGALGMERVSEELAAFFAHPEDYRHALALRLVNRLLERAQSHAAERRSAKALAALNHVLALDGTNAAAHQLLSKLSRARRRRKALAMGGWGALGVAVAAVALALGVDWSKRAWEAAGPSTSQQTGPAVTSAQVPVEVHIAPWGSLDLEDGTHLDAELSYHTLNLPPGKHVLTTRCNICEPTQTEIDVAPQGDQKFYVQAWLKPATVRFDYTPAEATVRLGDTVRTAAETWRHPFEVKWQATSAGVLHHVHYEVSLSGYQTASGDLELEPGKDIAVTGKLRSQ